VERRGEVAEIDLSLSDREIMQGGALALRRLPSSDGPPGLGGPAPLLHPITPSSTAHLHQIAVPG